MFSLRDEFRKWRKHMLRNPGLSEGDVAELESYIREGMAGLIAGGLDEEAAFRAAAGEPNLEGVLADEYSKVVLFHLKRIPPLCGNGQPAGLAGRIFLLE